MNYYSGIDLHWDNCYITTLDENGVIVKQQRVENIRKLLIAYFHSLPGNHIAVVESTTGWYWLNDLLEELGIELVLLMQNISKPFHMQRSKLIRLIRIPWQHSCAWI